MRRTYLMTVEDVYKKPVEEIEAQILARGYEAIDFRPVNDGEKYFWEGVYIWSGSSKTSSIPYILVRKKTRKRYILTPVENPLPGQRYHQAHINDYSRWYENSMWKPFELKEEEF